jgi:hypothetical protein
MTGIFAIFVLALAIAGTAYLIKYLSDNKK